MFDLISFLETMIKLNCICSFTMSTEKTLIKLMGYIRMFVEYDEKVRQDRRKQRESTSKKV